MEVGFEVPAAKAEEGLLGALWVAGGGAMMKVGVRNSGEGRCQPRDVVELRSDVGLLWY